MIAAAVAIAATAPAAERFWDRDLGGVARSLAEHPEQIDAPLFGDLLALCACAPLPPADGAAEPLRGLVRIEAARRVRLRDAASSRTLWRDVLRPDFFRRDPGNPALADALVWPDETERWTGEVLLVAAPKFFCRTSTTAPGPIDPAKLVDALRAAGYAEASSRLAYDATVTLLGAGERERAAALAASIDPSSLGDLGGWAHLARIVAGADPASAAMALEDDPTRPDPVAVAAVAADASARAGDWPAVLRATESLPPGDGRPELAFARALRARALFESSRLPEARAALPKDPAGKDLALELLARMPLDAPALELVAAFWTDRADGLLAISRRALAIGSFGTARAALLQLRPLAHVRAEVLDAALAFAQADKSAFAAAIAGLRAAKLPRGIASPIRSSAAVELAHAVAALAPAAPRGLRREASAAFESLRDDVDRSAARELDGAAAALRDDKAAAVGVIAVGSTLALPPLPPLRVEWPEPRSLLAIPDGHGGLRDWFADDERVAEGAGP